jgi:hypothetical protein
MVVKEKSLQDLKKVHEKEMDDLRQFHRGQNSDWLNEVAKVENKYKAEVEECNKDVHHIFIYFYIPVVAMSKNCYPYHLS